MVVGGLQARLVGGEAARADQVVQPEEVGERAPGLVGRPLVDGHAIGACGGDRELAAGERRRPRGAEPGVQLRQEGRRRERAGRAAIDAQGLGVEIEDDRHRSLAGEAADGGGQVQADIVAGEAGRRREGGRGVVGRVQGLGRTRGVFAQLVREARQTVIAQVQEPADLATVNFDRLGLAGHVDRRGGEVAKRAVGADVGELRGGVAGQHHPFGRTDCHPAGRARSHAYVQKAGEFVDELALDILRARRIAAGQPDARDVAVQLVDLDEQVVGARDAVVDLGVDGGPELGDLGVDPVGLAQEVLHVGHRLGAQQARRRVIGRRGEVGVDLVEPVEEEARARRVAEQALGVVEEGRIDIPAVGVGGGGQARRLQVLVGDPLDAGDADAHALAVDDQLRLVDDLADVPWRIDVGDVVRDRAQPGLGGVEA